MACTEHPEAQRKCIYVITHMHGQSASPQFGLVASSSTQQPYSPEDVCVAIEAIGYINGTSVMHLEIYALLPAQHDAPHDAHHASVLNCFSMTSTT